MEKHILIRYGELSLKKSNRNQFTQRIIQHIKTALAHFPNLVFQNKGLRYYIVLNDHDPEEIIPILKKSREFIRSAWSIVASPIWKH